MVLKCFIDLFQYCSIIFKSSLRDFRVGSSDLSLLQHTYFYKDCYSIKYHFEGYYAIKQGNQTNRYSIEFSFVQESMNTIYEYDMKLTSCIGFTLLDISSLTPGKSFPFRKIRMVLKCFIDLFQYCSIIFKSSLCDFRVRSSDLSLLQRTYFEHIFHLKIKKNSK